MVETPEVRSRIMRAIKSKDTKPEMLTRRTVHGMGYRYRLHRKDLPGKPDLVFPSRRKAIFVHGCFWHGHDCPHGSRTPKSNREYWVAKIGRNRERDAQSEAALKQAGWRVLIVWECQMKDQEAFRERLRQFLDSANP